MCVNAQAEARYPSGKGEVCKTFMRRFDPDPRLQILNKIRDCPNQLPPVLWGKLWGLVALCYWINISDIPC